MTRLPHVATKHNGRKGKIFNSLPHVIAVSKGVKKSIANESAQVIYNGIKPVGVLPKIENDVFTLLAVGRLDKIKGFDILIEECAKMDFPFKLHIVGEGEERKHLESVISKCKLKDKVSLLGFRQDIPQLMKNADIVVMSSHSEGFSLVMVESLFYANVFVSTKVSGATEVLDEIFLFEGFNISVKINTIFEQYTEFKDGFSSLKNEAQEKFMLVHIAQEHIRLYQYILKESNK
jgi:glycosyltransferase involved in cell wall biosynthesis